MPSRHSLDSVQSAPPPTITQQIATTQALNQSRDALRGQNDEREAKRDKKGSKFQEEKRADSLRRREDLPRTVASDGSPRS